MSTALLYLDFDGVLHSDEVYLNDAGEPFVNQALAPGRRLFEWADVLVQALASHHEVGIVLSTSWVVQVGPQRTLAALPAALRARVVGATYHPELDGSTADDVKAFRYLTRGEQVLRDVDRRRPPAWLAVDDLDEGFPPASRAHLVRTVGALGLSEAAVQEVLRAKLQEVTMVAGLSAAKARAGAPDEGVERGRKRGCGEGRRRFEGA